NDPMTLVIVRPRLREGKLRRAIRALPLPALPLSSSAPPSCPAKAGHLAGVNSGGRSSIPEAACTGSPASAGDDIRVCSAVLHAITKHCDHPFGECRGAERPAEIARAPLRFRDCAL